MEGTARGGQSRGRQHRSWADNITARALASDCESAALAPDNEQSESQFSPTTITVSV